MLRSRPSTPPGARASTDLFQNESSAPADTGALPEHTTKASFAMDSTETVQHRIEATTAAKWWADQMRGPAKMDAGSRNPDGTVDSGLASAEVMATMLHATEDRPASDADKFEAGLTAYVERRLSNDPHGYGCTLSTDYGPDYELSEVARTCGVGIGMSSLPWKTVMWVKPGSVKVSAGYGAEAVELLA